MANEEHLAILKKGVEAWNAWREKRAPLILPDLSRADLNRADLIDANLSRADLTGTALVGARLIDANLSRARLSGANLAGARLIDANLNRADLSGADLGRADLSGADLSGAHLVETVFGNTNLSGAKGLEECRFVGPCTIDHRTIERSGSLPLSFLRGCGLPDALIDYLPSLLNQPIQYYSCFISYSTKDEQFAHRLHADLQNNGVRCWFAPHDIAGGKKIHEQIEEAVRRYERLLLILSEHSMTSNWVATEIANARERETTEDRQVLFPIRLVDYKRIQAWKCFDADRGKDSAKEIREYFIPDFTHWKDHDAYTESFEQLLRDLKAET